MKNLKIYDSTLLHLNECEEKYLDYMKLLDNLDPELLLCFLSALKQKEVIDTQENENQDLLFVSLDDISHDMNSLDYLGKLISDKEKFTLDNLKELHNLSIRGTTSDFEENKSYRNIDVEVGKIIDGVKIISYIPPHHEEVTQLVQATLDYLNNDDNLFDNILIKPLIAHAALAYIQPFRDGNTRLARLVQHGKIFDLTNKKFEKNYNLPIMYLSKNYKLNRGYRRNIGLISVNKDNDSWNYWFKYNCNMIDEQLYYLDNQLKVMLKNRETRKF